MNLLRRTGLTVAVPLLALATILVGCNSSAEQVESSATTGAPSTTAAPKGTRGPGTTAKKTPECDAYRSYTAATRTLSAAKTDEAKKKAQPNVEKTANALKQASPLLTNAVDQYAYQITKGATGTQTKEDKDLQKRLGTDLNNWYRGQCF